MSRNFSRWALTFLGLALFLAGGEAMWRGWDIIQVERGWSLFIGGATALAGGAVVMALGQVLMRLDDILATARARPGREEAPTADPTPAVATPAAKPEETRSAEASLLLRARSRPAAPPPPLTAPEPAHDEPQEVDRYQSGDVTYVMFSDGAVEVRTASGAQRFASLAELRAQAAQQY